jgi:hypothetical protein
MAEDSKAAAMAKEVKAEVTAEVVKGEATDEDSRAAMAQDVEANATGEPVKGDATAEPVPTLRQIFSLPEKETDPSDDHWKTFREKVSKEIKGVKWISSMPDLAPKVCELLDIKIPDVLITAWKKVEDLRAVLEKSKKTPDETIYLELAQHTINSEHKPSVDVKIKGATVKKIELVIQIGFNLKGFLLKIQNGAIREMQTGQCEAKGTIKYGGLTVAEKKLEPIKLPFSIPIPAELPLPIPETKKEEEQPEPLERIEL